MALIRCPECGEMISDRAVTCIKCGYPIRELGVSEKKEIDKPVADAREEKIEEVVHEAPITDKEGASGDDNANAVPKTRLLEYLEHAIELEGAVLGEQTIIDDYKASSEQLKPTLSLEEFPSKPRWLLVPEMTTDDKGMKGLAIGMLVLAAICFVLAFFTSAAVLLAVLCLAIPSVSTLNSYNKKVDEINKATYANDAMQDKYNNEIIKLEKINRDRTSLYNKSLEEWKASTEKNLEYLTQKKGEVVDVLDKYYGADMIFPKYHTLPALTSIYEYLTSGRCTELTGPNGAYNLYEMEVRQNTVIEQLNTIISNLEQIRKNQFVLYQELTKVTSATRSIANEMLLLTDYTKQLTDLATLNTYYAAVTAQSTSAIAFMEMIG